MKKEWMIDEPPKTPDEWREKYKHETGELISGTEFDSALRAGFALGILATIEALEIIHKHPDGQEFRKELTTRINATFKKAKRISGC